MLVNEEQCDRSAFIMVDFLQAREVAGEVGPPEVYLLGYAFAPVVCSVLWKDLADRQCAVVFGCPGK